MKQTLLRAAIAASLCVFASCSNSSSGGVSTVPIMESEPNGTFSEANELKLGQNVQGALDTAGDADWWQLNLTGGQYITIQAFARRVDQAGWVANGETLLFKLYDSDGTTLLLQQSGDDFQWYPSQDTDVALFRVPASGTYFLALEQTNTAAAAGEYVVSVTRTKINETIQMETELAGVFGDNDTLMTAEPIESGMVQGWHEDDESDFYEITTTVPGLMRFTIVGHRNGVVDGGTYYDPELTLYDGLGNSLINNDDTFYLDSAIQHLALTPATFFIEVTECCGVGEAPYQLFYEFTPASQIGTAVAESEPNDSTVEAQAVQFDTLVTGTTDGALDFYSFACNAGDRIEIDLFFDEEIDGGLFFPNIDVLDSTVSTIDYALSGEFGNIRTILTDTGTYYLRIGTVVRGGPTPTPYAFRIRQTQSTFESEPNDMVSEAGTFDNKGRASGMMDTNSDVDVYEFQATEGRPVVFDILASSSNSTNGFFNNDDFGSSMDPILTIRDALGNVVQTADSDVDFMNGVVDGLPTGTLFFVPTASGTYYLEVEESYGESGTDTYYTVEMR